MSFFIEKEVECNFNFDYEKVAEAVVSASLEHESFPYEAEVNLTLTDNEGIHAINKEYRQIDRPTDVLSFPMLSYETPGDFSFLSDENEDDFNPDTGHARRHNHIRRQSKGTGLRIRTQRKKRICLSDYTQHASSVRI